MPAVCPSSESKRAPAEASARQWRPVRQTAGLRLRSTNITSIVTASPESIHHGLVASPSFGWLGSSSENDG
jgi:hypothetical protein